MKLVRISSSLLVNPAEVASVTAHERQEWVVVTLRNGETFTIDSDYGRNRWETMDRIVKAVEAAE